MPKKNIALTEEELSRKIAKDRTKTPLQLAGPNEWVMQNPILLRIVEESTSPTQAAKRATEQFAGLSAVNDIAGAVRKLTVLRISGKDTTWKALSKLPKDYQLADMFTFPPKTDTPDRFSFSMDTDFYPPGEGGVASHENLPPILREITDGRNTSISDLNGTSLARLWESIPNEVSSVKLTQPETPCHPQISENKVGMFHVSFDDTSNPAGPKVHQVRYFLPRYFLSGTGQTSHVNIISRVVVRRPAKGETYSTTYRQVSVAQDTTNYQETHENYEDSIVILFDIGRVPKKDSDESIGQIIFRRKYFPDKGKNAMGMLRFDYVIMPNLNLRARHKYLNYRLGNIVSFGNAHRNIAKSPYDDATLGVKIGKIALNAIGTFREIGPYKKSLNLQKMFGEFFDNPPDEIITLFQ